MLGFTKKNPGIVAIVKIINIKNNQIIEFTMLKIAEAINATNINSIKKPFETFINFRERTKEEERLEKDTYIEVYQSNKFENILIFLIAHMAAIFEEGPFLRAEMVSIINLLESEIETHK